MLYEVITNSMMPSVADIFAVNGRSIAASVSMLTPGIAPKIMPPNTPPIKNSTLVGLLKSATVPARKFSIELSA